MSFLVTYQQKTAVANAKERDVMKKYIPRFATVSFILFAISCIIYFISVRSLEVADFINSTVSVAVRFLLYLATYILPFSFFETLIILLPVILFLTVFLCLFALSEEY